MRRPFLFSLILAGLLCSCHEDPTPVDVTPNTPSNIGVYADPINIILYETGMQSNVNLQLLAQPIAPVYISATLNDITEFAVVPSEAIISPENWRNPVTFTLVPLDDQIRDNTQNVTLSFKTSSAENVWNELAPTNIYVTVIDNGNVTLDCAQTPNDPQCQQPIDCDKTPNDPHCQQPIDCDKTPNDPQCQQPIDCDKTPNDPQCQTGKMRIRFMAANTTSGSNQDYDDGKGIRMFQAMQPDIVLIQEFNYRDNEDSDIRSMVDSAFGKDFEYYRGSGSIPNGIISRYPIISSGAWKSNKQSNRNWDWAIIDIPGPKDLVAVSVHLGTDTYGSELSPLHEKIQALAGTNHYVVLGGDFNAKNRGGVRSTLGNKNAVFTVGKDGKEICDAGEFPVDQDGNSCTSAERDDPYDWLLFDKTLDTYEVPVEIGSHDYPNGHVLDSRVYDAHGEIKDIAPVKATDSWKCQSEPMCKQCKGGDCNNFQHMPVIRDIVLP